MNKTKTLKITLLIIILVLISVPFVQNKFNFIPLKPLRGVIEKPVSSKLTVKGWFSGEYQEKKEKYLNETFGFRSLCIRINNQIEHSLFNKANARSVIIGKNNYMYEVRYIDAYYGKNFVSMNDVSQRLEKLKFIQDTLNKLNKDIILIFAAGKASFYPEFIPDKYKTEKKKNLYEAYTEIAQQLYITHIDFNKYFMDNKHKSKYPLYPQYGIHWSYYGMCIAADSIIKFIENLRQIDMPNMYWEEVELSQPKYDDYDLGEGLNLFIKLKTFDMAYPKIEFESDSGKTKPRVLVISDSFYWGMYNFGVNKAFSDDHFWYYNKQVYPESFQNGIETPQIVLKDEIDKHDVIIIMATESTIHDIGWGFIDNAYNLFIGLGDRETIEKEEKIRIERVKNQIKSDEQWLNAVKEKAIKNKIPLDSMLTLDAIWYIQNQ